MRTTTATQENHTITKVVLAAAAAALFMSACGSSASSSDGTAATTPAGEAGAATSDGTATVDETSTADETAPDAADAAAGDDPAVIGETDAPVPTYEIDEALASQQLLPASGDELPCVEYVEATDYPLFACDRGPLVTDLQEALAGYDEVRIDGFFGTQTVEAVQRVQRSFGLYDTGIVDHLFIELIGPVDGPGDEVIDSGLTANDIAELCTRIIESGSPDISDFEYELCLRHGYLPVSTGE